MGNSSGLLYRELRLLARRHLQNERPGHTPQATAPVHEAYLRLADGYPDWQNRAHFFANRSARQRFCRFFERSGADGASWTSSVKL